jgi:hypothetical protein
LNRFPAKQVGQIEAGQIRPEGGFVTGLSGGDSPVSGAGRNTNYFGELFISGIFYYFRQGGWALTPIIRLSRLHAHGFGF